MTPVQWRRRTVWTVLALLVLAALVAGFWPKPVTVETARVKRAPLRVAVDEEGRTRVRDRFVVSAPVAGYARRLELDVGDHVGVGQPLVDVEPLRASVLDPRSRAEAEARVAAAKAALAAARQAADAAKATAAQSQSEYQRKNQLCQVQCISEDELEHARTEAQVNAARQRSGESAVEVARYNLEAARTALKYSAASSDQAPREHVILKSPIAGDVLKLHRRSEGVVAAGEPLIDLGDPHALEVEVEVLSQDAVRIHPGTPVLFERWGGGKTLQGVVRVVEPVGFTKVSALGVEEQRVLVIADITSPPEQWQRLGDGYRVEASFTLWQQEQVLQVPASALFRYSAKTGEGEEDQWAVFALVDGRARLRPVRIGERNGLAAQVLGGLKAGERVILHPSDEVADGVRVAAGSP